MDIKKEDAVKAYREGCEDVKQVLKTLFSSIDFDAETQAIKIRKGKRLLLEAKFLEFDGDDSTYKIEILHTEDSDGDLNHIWVSVDNMEKILKTQE